MVTEQLLDAQSLKQRVEAKGDLSLGISQSVLEAGVKMISATQSIDRPLLYSLWDVLHADWNPSHPDVGALIWEQTKTGDCSCAENWNCQVYVDMSSDVGGYGTRYCSIFQTIMFNKLEFGDREFFENGIGFDVNVTEIL